MNLLSNDGRTVLATVTALEGARRWLMKNLGDHSLCLIRQHKFKLNVWERPDWIVELNGGPHGIMFSIGK